MGIAPSNKVIAPTAPPEVMALAETAAPGPASRVVAQFGLIAALALMSLCLSILAAGAMDARQYLSNTSSSAVATTPPPAPQHLQAIVNP